MAFPYYQRVIKVGDSLAVVLPVQITRGLEIQRGAPVALSVMASDVVNIKLLADFELQERRVTLPEIE